MKETHGKGNNYIPGDKWEVCPRCGFDKRNSEMTVEASTGKRVCKECEDKLPSTPSRHYGG